MAQIWPKMAQIWPKFFGEEVTLGWYSSSLRRARLRTEALEMPKEIRCPACGNVGQATTGAEGAFDVRGQFEGRGVRKCRSCGAGLTLGWFGSAKIIPSPTWENMEELWEKEYRKMFRGAPTNDSSSTEGTLSKKFWDLSDEIRSSLHTPEFIKYCVDDVASQMTKAVLKHYSEVGQVFPVFVGEQGRKYLQGEFGAAIIEGYIIGRVAQEDEIPQSPRGQYIGEIRADFFNRVAQNWKEGKIDIQDEENALMAELVDLRMRRKGFKDLSEETWGKVANYVYLLLTNGLTWAKTEQEISEHQDFTA